MSIAAEPRTATGTVTRILVADPIAEDGVTRLRAAGEVDVMTGLEPSVLRERIGEVLRSLTPREREVIELRFGLRDLGLRLLHLKSARPRRWLADAVGAQPAAGRLIPVERTAPPACA